MGATVGGTVLVEYDRGNRTGIAVIALGLAISVALLGTDGPWRVALICGAVVAGLGYAAFGPSIRIELRDGHLRRSFLRGRTDLDLLGVTEVDVTWVPYGPLQLDVRSPDGLIGFAVDDRSEAFRRALGQELRTLGLQRRCTPRARSHLYLTGSPTSP